MNSVTVQQTSQGLLSYLEREAPDALAAGGVAVGWDARHQSQHFARVVAAVFLSRGVRVHLFSQL